MLPITASQCTERFVVGGRCGRKKIQAGAGPSTLPVSLLFRAVNVLVAHRGPHHCRHTLLGGRLGAVVEAAASGPTRWNLLRSCALRRKLLRAGSRAAQRKLETARRAQVHGMPAVATRGPGKRKVCARPDTPNLDSFIWRRSFDSNIQSRCQCIMSHSLIRGLTYLL